MVPQFWPEPVSKHLLHNVSAVHAFGYSFDLIEWEGASQQLLQLNFQNLSLSLL
jgi:hypothetical protein